MVFASCAHQMRTGLGTCHAMASNLAQALDCRNKRELRARLDELQSRLNELDSLLHATMDMFRHSTDDVELVSGNEEAAGVAALWRSVGRATRCALNLRAEAVRDSLAVRRTALREMLSILLQNACEADARSVVVTTDNSQHHALGTAFCVRVEDDGLGVDPMLEDKLFEPSCTTKAGKLGLGLYVASCLARESGGELSYDGAAEGGGAVFALTLPLRGDE